MAVRELPSGRWQVDVRVAGRRRRCSFSTEREACSEERRLLVARDGAASTVRDVRLDEFVAAVFWPSRRRLRDDTLKGYSRDLRLRILPALGWMRLRDVDHLAVQRMLSGCPTGKVARNARATLSTVLGCARDLGMVDANAASGRFDYPPDSKRPDGAGGVVLQTFAEHRALLDLVHSEDPGGQVERLLLLGLACGLRPGESRGLDWERVDLERREIRVVQTYVEARLGPGELCPPKTDRSARTVPLPGYAADLMAGWSRGGSAPDLFGVDAEPVAVNRRGGRVTPRASTAALARWLARHPDAPRVTLESCRHSFATACIAAGMEVSVLSRILGHRDVSTTYNRYVRPAMSALHAGADLVDAAFGDGLDR